MLKTIDHAAEAVRLLEENPVDRAADGAWGISIATEAQVHATLALVEQTKRVADYLGGWEQGYPLKVEVHS